MEQLQWNFPEKHTHTSEEDWDAFQEELNKRFIKVQDGPDILRWGYSNKGSFSVKENYSIRIARNAMNDDIWKKNWIANLWPKVSLFVWLVIREKILTSDNSRKRGIHGPSQCYLCYTAKELMNHLLDSFPFAAAMWDKGVMRFRRSDRRRGQPSQTLREWCPSAYKNPIIRTIWDSFPGMVMWCIWKERNARIF